MGHIDIILQRWRISYCTWPLTPSNRRRMFSGPTWILETAYSSHGCVTPAIFQVTQKSTSYECCLEKKKALQQVLLYRLLCNWTIWSSRSDGTWSASGRQGCCLELWWVHIGISQQGLLRIRSKAFPSSIANFPIINLSFWEITLGLLLGISGNQTFDSGSPGYHLTGPSFMRCIIWPKKP